MTESIKNLVTPFARANKKTMGVIIGVQIALFVVLWIYAAATSTLIPTPKEVVEALARLTTDCGLIREIIVSLTLTTESVLLTMGLSLLLCYYATLPVGRPTASIVAALRFLSFMGIASAFTSKLGGGHTLKVALLVFGMSVYYVTSMWDVIGDAANNLNALNHARTLGMGEWHVLWEVVIVGKFPAALEVLKQNFAVAFMLLVTVEGYARAEGGIGTLLLDNNKHMNMDAVFALQLIVLAIGLTADLGLTWLKGVLFPYTRIQKR